MAGVVGGQALLLPSPFQLLTDRPGSDPARAHELVCVTSVGLCPGPAPALLGLEPRSAVRSWSSCS